MTDSNKKVAQSVMTAVNTFCNEQKVAQYMTHEHRTLQQNFTRLCVEWLKALSEVEMYDDRNEASVRLAHDLFAIPEVKKLFDTGLPMI